MLKKLFLVPCSVLAMFLYNSANASGVFFGGGVGIMDGLVVETGYKMNPFISFRARGTYLAKTDISGKAAGVLTNVETSGNSLFRSLDINVQSHSLDLGLEVRPLPIVPILRSFTIIGSMQYLDAQMNVNRSLNGNVFINGSSYNVNGGSLNVTIANKNKFAPYLGIGYDILNLPFVSLRTTLGASIRSFEVSNKSYNLGSVLQTDIDAEIQSLNNRIGKNIIIPSLTLTARITL
jgi:hypothetical protein